MQDNIGNLIADMSEQREIVSPTSASSCRGCKAELLRVEAVLSSDEAVVDSSLRQAAAKLCRAFQFLFTYDPQIPR